MQDQHQATAIAHANIAFVKYWGHADAALHLPANPTISVNLDGLDTTTTVVFSDAYPQDEIEIDGEPANAEQVRRQLETLEDVQTVLEACPGLDAGERGKRPNRSVLVRARPRPESWLSQ
ncbi:MAG: hypothetical protein JXA89_16180 [Anaerolineae bacterium]|nr:hypothetical protein [Anaerolineae bacterium]